MTELIWLTSMTLWGIIRFAVKVVRYTLVVMAVIVVVVVEAAIIGMSRWAKK